MASVTVSVSPESGGCVTVHSPLWRRGPITLEVHFAGSTRAVRLSDDEASAIADALRR